MVPARNALKSLSKPLRFSGNNHVVQIGGILQISTGSIQISRQKQFIKRIFGKLPPIPHAYQSFLLVLAQRIIQRHPYNWQIIGI